MARKRWLHFVAGTSFILTMGCQSPNGPGTIRTIEGTGGAAPLSGPRFPGAPAPGSPAAKSTSLPPPNMPPIDNSPMKIGSPAALSSQMTTPAMPKLRQFDPSTGAPVHQNDAFPPANPGAVNTSRNASPAAFEQWNDPRTNPSSYAPIAGQQTAVPAQMTPPPLTSLPNALPAGASSPFAQPNVTMPQVSMPSIPSMPAPTYPTTPAFPPPPTVPNAPTQSNSPAAPNLNAPGASRQAIYPGTNP